MSVRFSPRINPNASQRASLLARESVVGCATIVAPYHESIGILVGNIFCILADQKNRDAHVLQNSNQTQTQQKYVLLH